MTADDLAARFGLHPVYVRDVVSKHWRGFPRKMNGDFLVPEAGIDRHGFMRPAEAMA